MTILKGEPFYAISANHLKIGYDDDKLVPDFDVVIHKHDYNVYRSQWMRKIYNFKSTHAYFKMWVWLKLMETVFILCQQKSSDCYFISQQQTMPPDITVEELVGFWKDAISCLQRLSDEEKIGLGYGGNQCFSYEKTQHFCIVRRWKTACLVSGAKPEMLFLMNRQLRFDIRIKLKLWIQ